MEKIKVIAYIRLKDKGLEEDCETRTLGVEVEKVNVILNNEVISDDVDFDISIVGVEGDVEIIDE